MVAKLRGVTTGRKGSSKTDPVISRKGRAAPGRIKARGK
jgi:hypothetical protein